MANIDYDRDPPPVTNHCVIYRNEPWQSENLSFNQMLDLQSKQAMAAMMEQERYDMARTMQSKSVLAKVTAEELKNHIINAVVQTAHQSEKQKAKLTPIQVMNEALDSLEYLLADVRGNVKRNPKLDGLDTNFAMRRASEALMAAREVMNKKR